MSFILDALRKSEKERLQTAVPGISDVPTVVQSTRIPKWILAVIAGLSIGVLFFGWAWWQSADNAEISGPNRFGGVLPQSEQVPESADSVRSLSREIAAPAGATPPPETSTRPFVAPPVPASVEPAAQTPTMTVGAPTMLELIAAGSAIPLLTLELHVYSETPAQRFVRINSASYREGDTLPEGARVVSISEEGAILDYRGEVFLLSSD